MPEPEPEPEPREREPEPEPEPRERAGAGAGAEAAGREPEPEPRASPATEAGAATGVSSDAGSALFPLLPRGSAVLRVVAARDARDATRETGDGPVVGKTPHRDVPVRVRDHLGRARPVVPNPAARGGSLRRRLRRRRSLRRASPRASFLLPRPSFLLLRASFRLFLLFTSALRALRLIRLVLDVVCSLRGAREDGVPRHLPRFQVIQVPLVRVIVMIEAGRGAHHRERRRRRLRARPPRRDSQRHGCPLEDVKAVAVGVADVRCLCLMCPMRCSKPRVARARPGTSTAARRARPRGWRREPRRFVRLYTRASQRRGLLATPHGPPCDASMPNWSATAARRTAGHGSIPTPSATKDLAVATHSATTAPTATAESRAFSSASSSSPPPPTPSPPSAVA